MIEQYRKDVSQIHASSELIQRTRTAMKQEEERLKEEEEAADPKKPGKRNPYGVSAWRIAIPLSAVAAALFLVIVPGVIHKGATQEDIQIQMAVPLGQKEEQQPVSIENGSNQPIELTEVARMPAEFADAEKIEKDGAVYYILRGESTDEWKAYAKIKGKKYLLCGKAAGKEDFLNRIEALLFG